MDGMPASTQTDETDDVVAVGRQPGTGAAEPGAKRAERRGLWFKFVAVAAAVLVAAGGATWYWRESMLYPATSDAYVGANVVRIAPLVAGRIARVRVKDYQRVRAGEVLVEIDKRPLEAVLSGAEARLKLAQQQAAVAEAAIGAAEAHVVEARAQLADTQKQTERVLKLAAKGDAASAERDHAEAQLKTARATVAAAEAALVEAQKALGVSGDENANVKAAAAAVASARLDIEHATIRAPQDGIVGAVDIRPGAVVAVGTALFPLVEAGQWWVDANFKETDLARIKPGETATVTLDLYPSRRIKGLVEALSPASGAAFSLLPPENATGNWVKVTQRFPVRIRLNLDASVPPLRIGASASVRVDTVGAEGAGEAR